MNPEGKVALVEGIAPLRCGSRENRCTSRVIDGIGVGLRTSDGRHVGYLTLLTYRAGLVPATAAALPAPVATQQLAARFSVLASSARGV